MKLAPPFPGAKGFGLSRHKETLPRTLVMFSSATRWPLFRASVPARSRFSCREGGNQPGQLQRDFQRPFAPTHSPAQRKSPATTCAW